MLYKCYLIDRYKPNTVNLRIRAMNCFMEFLELPDSRVLMVRLQQKPFLENVCAQKSPAQYKLATWYLQDTAFSKR